MTLPEASYLSCQMCAAQYTIRSILYTYWELGIGQILVPKFTGTMVLRAFGRGGRGGVGLVMHCFENPMGPVNFSPTNTSILLAISREFTGSPKRHGSLETCLLSRETMWQVCQVSFCPGTPSSHPCCMFCKIHLGK